MNAPTPRTDAAAVDLSYYGEATIDECRVPVPFARELELELAALRQAWAEREPQLLSAERKVEELHEQLSAFHRERESERTAHMQAYEMAMKEAADLRTERDEWKSNLRLSSVWREQQAEIERLKADLAAALNGRNIQ